MLCDSGIWGGRETAFVEEELQELHRNNRRERGMMDKAQILKKANNADKIAVSIKIQRLGEADCKLTLRSCLELVLAIPIVRACAKDSAWQHVSQSSR